MIIIKQNNILLKVIILHQNTASYRQRHKLIKATALVLFIKKGMYCSLWLGCSTSDQDTDTDYTDTGEVIITGKPMKYFAGVKQLFSPDISLQTKGNYCLFPGCALIKTMVHCSKLIIIDISCFLHIYSNGKLLYIVS